MRRAWRRWERRGRWPETPRFRLRLAGVHYSHHRVRGHFPSHPRRRFRDRFGRIGFLAIRGASPQMRQRWELTTPRSRRFEETETDDDGARGRRCSRLWLDAQRCA